MVTNLFHSRDLRGEFLLTPLKNYHDYVIRTMSYKSGWGKVAFAVSQLAVGIFVYPLFATFALIGMGAKVFDIRSLHQCNENEKNRILEELRKNQDAPFSGTSYSVESNEEIIEKARISDFVQINNSQYKKISFKIKKSWEIPANIMDLSKEEKKLQLFHLLDSLKLSASDDFLGEKRLETVLEIEAEHDLELAKTTTKLFKDGSAKSAALGKIAKIAAQQNRLGEAKAIASTLEGGYKEEALFAIAKREFSNDLGKLKEMAGKIEREALRNKSLVEIVEIETQQSPKQAIVTLSIIDTYWQNYALVKLIEGAIQINDIILAENFLSQMTADNPNAKGFLMFNRKNEALLAIVKALKNAMPEKAKNFAEKITYYPVRSHALFEIVEAQANVNLEIAKKLSNLIQDQYWKALALLKITQAEKNTDLTDVESAIEEIKNPSNKVSALIEIAKAKEPDKPDLIEAKLFFKKMGDSCISSLAEIVKEEAKFNLAAAYKTAAELAISSGVKLGAQLEIAKKLSELIKSSS